ncbi:Saccharopine dehydrogenase [Catenaria anguillulae PL171]|uniref:Saccharopine dehydrogenase [NAD(+), L-lysine-forming] n=1 Tax=Catenaria anguillulae PL171 TaxID=765915 RepID=A0A1Y2HJA8_9FUNG|nr:Saccharopine dehydrogenase [Catenaria anguillulae PL171]
MTPVTNTPAKTHLWLRAETKADEHRSALTPTHAAALLARGTFQITVESDPQRIFPDSEFAAVGCTLAPSHSWRTQAPAEAIILGLKELTPEDTFPLTHNHIHFAHCFKHQAGWYKTLKRFHNGNGTLYDLEFLNDEHGRRVAAFGFMAGFAGAAVGLDVWASASPADRTNFPSISAFPNEAALLTHIKARLAARAGGQLPKVLVIGALGRCGRGAVDMLRKAGLPESHIAQWDLNETKRGGPFPEIATDYDVFINCIYLSSPIPPFLTRHELDLPNRKLSVLVDVSCDPNNPHNPIPVYGESISTFVKPTITTDQGLHVVAIDHLPSLLPREASEMFVADLLPSLVELENGLGARVWREARQLFEKKVGEAKSEYPNEFSS